MDGFMVSLKINFINLLNCRLDYYPLFVVCANGHRYFIGNVWSDNCVKITHNNVIMYLQCGRPWVEKKCNVCKAPIGGRSHELAAGEELGTM